MIYTLAKAMEPSQGRSGMSLAGRGLRSPVTCSVH